MTYTHQGVVGPAECARRALTLEQIAEITAAANLEDEQDREDLSLDISDMNHGVVLSAAASGSDAGTTNVTPPAPASASSTITPSPAVRDDVTLVSAPDARPMIPPTSLSGTVTSINPRNSIIPLAPTSASSTITPSPADRDSVTLVSAADTQLMTPPTSLSVPQHPLFPPTAAGCLERLLGVTQVTVPTIPNREVGQTTGALAQSPLEMPAPRPWRKRPARHVEETPEPEDFLPQQASNLLEGGAAPRELPIHWINHVSHLPPFPPELVPCPINHLPRQCFPLLPSLPRH